VWTTGFGRAAFDTACSQLAAGPAVGRDYCKSVKHSWREAMYIPGLGDTATAWTVAQRMVELRGDEATDGFVLEPVRTVHRR
jgi:hypothetical protein